MRKAISNVTVVICSLLLLTSVAFAAPPVNPFADFFNLPTKPPTTETVTPIVDAAPPVNPFADFFNLPTKPPTTETVTPIVDAAPPVNPFADFFNLPTKPPTTETVTPIVDTKKNPFLQEFLRVYEGDWIYTPTVAGEYASVDIFKDPCVCNNDETECCGKFEVRSLDGNTTKVVLEGLFCLNSTYEIHIKDLNKTWDMQCIGVRGARMESPLRIPGYAIDDPTIIECQTFKLVRPE